MALTEPRIVSWAVKSLALLVFASSLLFTCKRPERTIPDSLVGVWTAVNDRRYADRYFELRGDGLVVFGIGGDNSESYVIAAVEETVVGTNEIQYSIDYVNLAGELYRFSFVFNPAGRSIALANQNRTIWKPTS